MEARNTKRLRLRAYTMDDREDVHAYASDKEILTYMQWGPNTWEDTHAFLTMAIEASLKEPCSERHYAAVDQETGIVIGGCMLALQGDQAEIGWILHHDYWNKGYGTEMGQAMLELGFGELGLHRVVARCDSENQRSYRLMEKLGMRQEGTFLDARPAYKGSSRVYSDEAFYAILREEWLTRQEIAYYNTLPYQFTEFCNLKDLYNGEIRLVCLQKQEAVLAKHYLPAYHFAICKGSEKIGSVNLRIGYQDTLYYGGHIGYDVNEAHRGHGYAVQACEMLKPLALKHGMHTLLITNAVDNQASMRVCEKLQARKIRVARVPKDNELYRDGVKFVNIYEWNIN